jgi:hypothetical protein
LRETKKVIARLACASETNRVLSVSWRSLGPKKNTVSFRQQCMIFWNNHALLPKTYKKPAFSRLPAARRVESAPSLMK